MNSKPWLLPDGVEEILPEQAAQIESLRRHILDVYQRWGYQLVITPLIEFSESLFLGLGKDMQKQTLQFGDPMSAGLLALRADITPQIARMDAHTLAADEANQIEPVNRLCYVGSVVKSRLSTSSSSRTPLTIGAELYGDASIEADGEVILLMLETLKSAGLNDVHLALGNVEIYRQLIADVNMSELQAAELFDALQRKSQTEIDELLANLDISTAQQQALSQLASLHGDITCLEKAKTVLSSAPKSVLAAIENLQQLAQYISDRSPDTVLYFDLSELSTYNYHSGLVFSALTPGLGRAIAKGGRYDHVGEVFGRARPATGFHVELKTLSELTSSQAENVNAIYALENNQAELWQAMQALRAQNEVVICTRDEKIYQQAQRRLVLNGTEWSVAE